MQVRNTRFESRLSSASHAFADTVPGEADQLPSKAATDVFRVSSNNRKTDKICLSEGDNVPP